MLGAMASAHPILEFWFGSLSPEGEVAPEKQARWWKKSAEFDSLCKERFESDVQAASRDELEDLRATPRGALAYILLCDQIPRNIYRDTTDAFAWDARALAATMALIESGEFLTLFPREQAFALMPLMHSEDLDVHTLSIKMFTELAERGVDTVDYARAHQKIIMRFGRYPHRNVIVGRESSAEEIEFLKEPGSSF